MSNFNFENWDLNESDDKAKKRVRQIDAEELSIIISDLKEDLTENGLWNRQYGINDPKADARGSQLDRDSWERDLNPKEQEELKNYYDQMYLEDKDEDAANFFVGSIEQADMENTLANDPGVTVVDDPVDAGMFELDNPAEQGSLAIDLDESDEDDQGIDTSRFDLAMQDAEEEDLEGLGAASDIYDMLMSQMSEQDGDDRSLDGLEGPFTFKNGRELYYDPREEGGQYYDRGTDIYLDNDEASRVVMDEQDSEEINVDVSDQSSAGSFYTGEDDADQDLTGGGMGEMDEQNFLQRMFGKQNRQLPKALNKKSELPSKFMAWVQAYKLGKDAKTKMILAKKVLDMVGDIGNDDEAIKNLAHWVNYTPDGFADLFRQLRSDAEGSLMREMDDGQRSLPEPFWSHGFPQVKIRDVAEAIGDSMVPGQDKRGTLGLIDMMRQELDRLESNIKSGK